jgi:hypothetical protein
MKAHGNGTPETCASNLLRIVRGEVAYDRVRGRDGALIDQPNATDEAIADAEWVLETYEPRVSVESIEEFPEEAQHGDISTLVKIKRKEEEEE